MALDEKAKDATHAFVTKLMQLAGFNGMDFKDQS